VRDFGEMGVLVAIGRLYERDGDKLKLYLQEGHL
jgi:hypothetical protein